MGAILILVVGGLLAAMLILPRQRELRRHQAVVAQLHVGDQVMTTSGLYGTITDLADDLAWLELAPGMVVKVARRAIATQVPPAGAAAPEAEGTNDQASDGTEGRGESLGHDVDGRAG